MTAADDYDPFETFSQAFGAGRANPYPDLVAQRYEAPVAKLDPQKLAEGSVLDASKTLIPEGLNLYGALSFEAVAEVLRDGATFSSSGYAMLMGPVMGRTILQMDEPIHSRYRKLVSTAFTRRALERWEDQLVRPIVARCIEDAVDGNRLDLVRGVTFPFPVNVIAGLLGLPAEDLHQFHRWAVELISVTVDAERAMAASRSLGEYFGGILEQRRRSPGDDMISILAEAEIDGERLEDEDIFAFLRLLLPAGAETTYRSSSNLLVGLLSNPEQLDRVRDEPDKWMDRAIEEGLRWECPLLGIMRISTAEREVCGVKVPAGAIVMVNLGSANHDETRWDEPERFDITRPEKPHMAFAYGAHSCLGAHLARMETRILLEELFAKLPNMRLDPEAEPPEISGVTFRSPAAIPVVFDR